MPRALLLLLSFALLASVYTQHDEPWKCTHDQQEKIEPERIDVEEEGFKDAKEGRLLTSSYSNLRAYGYYGLLSSTSSTMKEYLQNDLVPAVLSYFEATLKVKYPVSGLLKTSSSSVCGYSTPSILKSGVQADFVYMVEVEDAGTQWVMNSMSCSLASGTSRPLFGLTKINSYYITPTTSDVLLHEKNMLCLMHEMTHTLGFSSSMFKHFIDSNGKTLSGHILSGSLDGSACQIINVEPLTTKLRSYFGCSSLKGAYMENSGSDATAGSHFERRQFGFEAMTSGLIYQEQYSQFSLAMLESSGWYVPDYNMADAYFWGQGEGCSFLTGTCSANAFDEWCSSSNRACTNPGRGGGSCASDGRSDNCKFIHPSVSYDCENSGADAYARLPDLQTFGRGTGSKCFEGTLATSKAGSSTTYCFKYSCSGSGDNTILNIEVGSKTVQCNAKGSKTVAGYAGSINCPDPLLWCSTVGQKVCPRGCMGRGSCVNGKCSCYSGFKGEDCALNA